MPTNWRDRPVPEIIVLILATSVGTIIVVLTLAVVVAQFTSPSLDFIGAARVISNVINTVIGALIGYMAGNRSTSIVQLPPPPPVEKPAPPEEKPDPEEKPPE